MIPRSLRIWLPAIAISLFFIFTLRRPRAISQATSYATDRWRGKPTDLYWDNKGSKASSFASSATTLTQWDSSEAKVYWEEYFKVLTHGKPNFDEIRFRSDRQASWFPPTFQSTDFTTSRKQDLNMTGDEIEEMKSKHRTVSEKIKELAPKLPFKAGTRGIVYSTEIEVMPFLTVSLRMLRKTGTTLPVEIWIWDRSNWEMKPYGLRMCDEVFQPLGATCRFTTEHLPDSRPPPYDKPTEKYQNKFDALMFSSFEQVLILDSDNVPLMPLDDIFTAKPFTSHGLILWPDYWRNAASPYFYEITSVKEESPLERASTESGQIFLNKASHAAVLLLARYYGLYKDHWIRLLSQDPADEGDKETFQRAARVMDLTFYQVAEPPDRVGYRCNKSQKPLASGQHHPVDDYFLSSLDIRRENTDDMLQDGLTPRTLFIHCNLPKLDPAVYMAWYDPDAWPDLQRCNGVAHRMWGARSLTMLKYGWDVEKTVWDQMRWVACNTEHLQAHWFHPNPRISNATIAHVCERFVPWYEELMESDGGAAQGLIYDPSLSPTPFDPDGEFTKGYSAQKQSWSSTTWRWPIAETALKQKDGGKRRRSRIESGG